MIIYLGASIAIPGIAVGAATTGGLVLGKALLLKKCKTFKTFYNLHRIILVSFLK